MSNRRFPALLAAPVLLAGLVLVPIPAAHAEGEHVSDMQVIPALKQWDDDAAGAAFSLTGDIVLADDAGEELTGIAETLAEDLTSLTGADVQVDRHAADEVTAGDIHLALTGDADLGEEGYELAVDGSLTINAHEPHGVFNGTRTILQLLTRADAIPAGTARDWPTKPVRSVLVDNTPRHFSLNWWESFFRQMSYYKLNDTNLYIDGAGLTETEMRRIDELAQQFYVQLVPQLNMPGHMATVLPSHPEYQLVNQDGTLDTQALDLSNEEAVEWSLGIIDDAIDDFSAGTWHLGSDEFPGWPGTGENHPHLTDYAKEKLGEGATFADLFASYQNRANELVDSHGKSMRVWNDMIRASDIETLDPDVTVEYWIYHNELAGLLTPQQIADRGNHLINADVDLLYYDMSRRNLDPRDLYERFDVNTFTGNHPVDPEHVDGARIAVWLAWIGTPMESDAEVLNNLRPDMAALTQHTWGDGADLSWTDFSALNDDLGVAPGFIGSGNDIAGEVALTTNPDGTVVYAARSNDGDLHVGRQHDPGSGPWSKETIAEGIAGDPRAVVDAEGRTHIVARTGSGQVLHAWQSEPGADTFDTATAGEAVTGDPAPFVDGEDVGWVARAGEALVASVNDVEQVALAEGVSGEAAVTVAGGTVHALAGTADGSVHAWSTDEGWESVTDEQRIDDRPVLVTAGDDAVALVRDGGSLRARTLTAGEPAEWIELDGAARGQVSAAVDSDGRVHAAYLRDGNVWYAQLADGEWTTRVGWYDFVGDPAILIQSDGAPLVMGQNNRGFLAAVQPDPGNPDGGWQWTHLAESTTGTPATALDADGRPIYLVATTYGDLQTGTRWGDINQWGRDFVIGTINYPGDEIAPDKFTNALVEDDFSADTADSYELFGPSESEAALAPTVADGRLEVTGERYYSLLASPQTLPGEGAVTVGVDIEEFTDVGGAENSLFLGYVKDADNRVTAWYNRNIQRLGFDIVVDGEFYGGWGDVPVQLRPGDRLALTLSGRWVTAYRFHEGVWDRIHTAPVNGTDDLVDPQVRAEYHPGFGFRADAGTLAIDNFSMHGPGAEVPDPDPTDPPDPDPTEPDPDPTEPTDPTEPDPDPTEPEPTQPEPTEPGESPTGGSPGDPGGPGAEPGDDGGLPTTGVSIASLLAAVAALVAAGLVMRRRRRLG